MENEDRSKTEKLFKDAIDRPHLLIFAEKLVFKSTGKPVEGLSMRLQETEKLQFALARFSDGKELQDLIDFFTEALERHRKIDEGEKAEVIPLNGKPDDRR